MTKENVLRLYEHYSNINYVAAKEDLEEKRPWVASKDAEVHAAKDFEVAADLPTKEEVEAETKEVVEA